MDILIPWNTTIPYEKFEKYQNAKDNQTKIDIKVYQRIWTELIVLKRVDHKIKKIFLWK